MNCSGFTLIEVLVAIVILATGLVVVIQALGGTQQILRISENMTLAAQILEERFAETEIKLLEFKKLSLASDDGEEKFPGKLFTWTRRVRLYDGEALEDQTRLNQVEVVVNWKEGASRNNIMRIDSLFMNRDLEKKT